MSAASGGGVPVMSKDQLEYIADQHTLSFGRYDGKEDPGFSAWKFAAYYLKKTVRFEWLSNDGCILGLSSFARGTRIPVYLPDENGMDWLELGPNTILLSKMFEDSFIYPGKSINGGTPKYSVSLIVPKSDAKTVAKIKAAIEAA